VTLSVTATSLVYQIYGECDDSNNTVLEVMGFPRGSKNWTKSEMRCNSGYNGWDLSFGSYIDQLKFDCADSSQSSLSLIGFDEQLSTVSKSSGQMSLQENMKIIGFHVYFDSIGIKAISIAYGVIPSADEIENRADTAKGGMLSFLWGVLAMSALTAIVLATRMFINRRRRKIAYRRHDRILPLK
jgi:hypothetical protein